MKKNMQKWEIDLQKKIHNNKVKTARPTIRYPNSAITNDPHLNSTSSQEENDVDSSLNRILKSFHLQQYFKKLCEMGYEHNIQSLANLKPEEKENLYNHLHIMPGHKSKFESLFELLRQLQPRQEQNTRRSNSLSSQGKDRTRRPSSGAHPKTSPKNSVPEDSSRYQHILEKFKNLDIQHGSELYRDDALNMIGHEKSIGSDATTEPSSTDEEKIRLQKELEIAQSRIEELKIELEKKQRESPKPAERSFDPFEPLPEIEKRSDEVGVSYDSAKIRSTLHHIDIEEMCRSLSKAVVKLVKHGMDVEKNRIQEPSLKISLASLPDFFEDSSNMPESLRSKNSLVSSNFSSSIGSSLDYSSDSVVRYSDLQEIAEESQENSPFKDAGEVAVPKSIQEIFKENFDDHNAYPGVEPIENEIYNFSRNIIVRSKMEKECSIICLIYMERLIEKTGIYITEMNWKKLLLFCLILASKIWDDESYENVHFAQVFSIITLKELNAMEMTFLSLIDYNVGIKNSEYAKYYFVLRTYSERDKRSFPLKPLDVDTVRRLQKNAGHAEALLREKHSESLFKTL